MSLAIYRHAPLSDDLDEYRAIVHLARLISDKVGHSKQPYTLVANIDPSLRPSIGPYPPLDALLLSPDFSAIIALFPLFDPVVARHLNGRWYTNSNRQRLTISGGKQRNPFLQVQQIRATWQYVLQRKLHVFLLFYPYLHPDSELPSGLGDNEWLTLAGIDEIQAVLNTVKTPGCLSSAAEQQALAEKELKADPWPMEALLTRPLGYIHVLEPRQPQFRCPVYRFDAFTLGRSQRVQHRIRLQSPQVSGTHARLYVSGNRPYLEDLNSKNGLYLDQIRQDAPIPLQAHVKVGLGSHRPEASFLWYTPLEKEQTALFPDLNLDSYSPSTGLN